MLETRRGRLARPGAARIHNNVGRARGAVVGQRHPGGIIADPRSSAPLQGRADVQVGDVKRRRHPRDSFARRGTGESRKRGRPSTDQKDIVPEDIALPLVGDDVIDGAYNKENMGRVALAPTTATDATATDGLVIHKRMSVQRSNHVHVENGVSRMEERRVVCVQAASGERQGELRKETVEVLARRGSPDDVLAAQSLPSMPTVPSNGLEHGTLSKNKRKKRTHRTRSRVAGMESMDAGLSSQPGAHSAPTIESLPNDCLRQIFKHCGTEEERASVLPSRNPLLSTLPLVCKKWRAILDSPNDAWSTLAIDLSTSLDYTRMQTFMERRLPSIRRITLTNEKRIIRTTAQRDNWVTMLSSLDGKITSTWESLRIENARVYELIDFFLLDRPIGPDSSTTLTRLTNLKALDLSDLSTLPKRFSKLMKGMPSLENVSLSFDALVTDGVPAFDGCDVGKLPEYLFDPRLKSLKIRCKYITAVSEAWLNRMVNLEHLSLERMATKQTFPSVHGLCKLRTLGLTGSTGFFGRDAPDPSSSFNSLTANSLTERMFMLFKSIPTLEELVIDGCGIKEIPMAGNHLASPTVKKLSINNNPDMVFKKGLGLFHGLEHLSMRRCNMPCVSSAVTGLVNLKYLDISNNGLVECNNLGKLKSLETLIASQNPFPCIPRDIVGLNSLRVIDLSGCVYLEFNSSLSPLMDAWPHLARLDVRKQPDGGRPMTVARYQATSKHWLALLRETWNGGPVIQFHE